MAPYLFASSPFRSATVEIEHLCELLSTAGVKLESWRRGIHVEHVRKEHSIADPRCTGSSLPTAAKIHAYKLHAVATSSATGHASSSALTTGIQVERKAPRAPLKETW
eukprot:159276-Pleurochrysis_carterae.AAC.1